MSNSINSVSWFARFNRINEQLVADTNKKTNTNSNSNSIWNNDNCSHNNNTTSPINNNSNTGLSWYEKFTQANEKFVAGCNNKPIISKDANGNKIENYYDKNGNSTQTINYNKDGKLTASTVYNTDGSIKNKTNRINNADNSYKDTIYNGNGKKVEENSYNKDGLLTKATAYNADGSKVETAYALNGNKIKENSYNKEGKLTHYNTFNDDGSINNKIDRLNNADNSFKDVIYDANGVKLRDNSYNSNNKLTDSTSYNANGSIKNILNRVNNADNSFKDTIYDASGTKVKDNSYDANGNKLEENAYDKGKLSKSTSYKADGSRIETFYDDKGQKTEGEEYNKDGQLTSNYIYRKGDNGYGSIDWNNDGKMDGYVAKHGDFDNFFTHFGQYWQLPDLENIVNNLDNSDKDTDKRAGFVSDGKVTSHKISDTQIGFNVTAKDMTQNTGFNYDYAVWDKQKNSYIVGTDKNKDGNLTGDEIECIVENVGNKTCSPLTFDLNGDGVKTSGSSVQYDIDGDGKIDTINDVDDATLSIRGGKDGKDLFGDNTDLDGDGEADGFANGFDALKALAEKEGLINGKNDMVLDSNDIKILENKYQFGMKTSGYNSAIKTLESLGITEINLGNTDEVSTKDNFDGRGNSLMEQAGATFKINGKDREYADVWHSIQD